MQLTMSNSKGQTPWHLSECQGTLNIETVTNKTNTGKVTDLRTNQQATTRSNKSFKSNKRKHNNNNSLKNSIIEEKPNDDEDFFRIENEDQFNEYVTDDIAFPPTMKFLPSDEVLFWMMQKMHTITQSVPETDYLTQETIFKNV